jgi:hypothetical protein
MMPEAETLLLVINMVIALTSAVYNFVYYFSHKNGKKHLRLLCAFIMLYFAVIYGAAALNFLEHVSFGSEYLRPFIWLLFFIPMWDARADWNRGV